MKSVGRSETFLSTKFHGKISQEKQWPDLISLKKTIRPPPPNSCVGVTRPTLKIPPTLEDFFKYYCAIFVRNCTIVIRNLHKSNLKKKLYGLCLNVPSMCFDFCLYFLCFYEYIHRVCVYKWAYCWVKKNKKKITDLPTLFFSTPLRQHNNFFWPN